MTYRLAFAAAATLIAAPALAQNSFHASLAKPAAASRIVARETLWNCAGTDCRATRSGFNSDMNECRAMTRRLGRVESFIAGERPFDAAQIEKCNAGIAG